MKESLNGKELWRLFEKEIDIDKIWDDAVILSQWERYSGSPAGEASVEFIMKRLRENGVEPKCEKYDVYRSLPKSAMVKVLSPYAGRCFAATACVYSASCTGLRGELVYDEMCSREFKLSPKEQETRLASFSGKIVLTRTGDVDFAYKAANAGAKAVLRIWAFDVYHHWPIGENWGTPSPDKAYKLHPCPTAELKKGDGEELVEMLKNGPVEISMDVEMENKVLPTSMPTVFIQGKSDKFVLISGHYDSWYNGMTDNGAANVIMLEMARIFKLHQAELDRSVLLGWWSGHSDAKYAGSTWFADNYWKMMYDNCVGHIFVDIAGCKTSDEVFLRRTGMEGETFGHDLILEYTGKECKPYVPMPRAADQSFYGANLPISIFPRYVESAFFDSTGKQVRPHFYWWHTASDTLDKCSKEIILRDMCINAGLACYILNSEMLPVDIPFFIGEMERFLGDIEKDLNEEFDITPVYVSLDKVKKLIPDLLSACEGKDSDDIIKRVAGGLTRLVYSSVSPYENTPIYNSATFALLNRARCVTRENASPTDYLFIKTEFVRQRNRLVGGLELIAEQISSQLMQWGQNNQ